MLTIAPFFIGLFAAIQVPITVMVGHHRLQTAWTEGTQP
jgi:hypothetical protein